jgi:hypothetical protein
MMGSGMKDSKQSVDLLKVYKLHHHVPQTIKKILILLTDTSLFLIVFISASSKRR